MVYVTAGNVLNIVNTGKTVIETETRCTTSRKMPSLTQAPSRTDTTLSNIWKVMTQPRQHIKKQRHYFTNKVCLVKAMVFPVVMYGCESWTIKKAECRRIDAFELWCWRRLFESPLDCKEIQPVYPKGDQSWVFIGRTDVEAETPVLWPPHAKS